MNNNVVCPHCEQEIKTEDIQLGVKMVGGVAYVVASCSKCRKVLGITKK